MHVSKFIVLREEGGNHESHLLADKYESIPLAMWVDHFNNRDVFALGVILDIEWGGPPIILWDFKAEKLRLVWTYHINE